MLQCIMAQKANEAFPLLYAIKRKVPCPSPFVLAFTNIKHVFAISRFDYIISFVLRTYVDDFPTNYLFRVSILIILNHLDILLNHEFSEIILPKCNTRVANDLATNLSNLKFLT